MTEVPIHNHGLSLPLRVYRGQQLKLMIPALMGSLVLMAVLFLGISDIRDQIGITPAIAIVGALAILDLMVAIFLIRLMKPAIIEIDRGMVWIRPLPLFLLSSPVQEAQYPRTSFVKVNHKPSQQSMGMCVLEPRAELAERIEFLPPPGLTARQCADALNQLLDYKG